MEIKDEWDERVKEQHQAAHRGIREGLIHTYGADGYEQKIQNFIDLDVAPSSVQSVHNELLAQIRSSFTLGAYYPALVGAGALGERLLNEMFLRLRKYFLHHPATQRVRSNSSIDDWRKLIAILGAWKIFDDDVSDEFDALRRLRNTSVHFGLPNLHETGGRTEALEAIQHLQKIISKLFPAVETSPFFIPNTQGAFYIRRDAEDLPFVKEFLIPASVLVTPENEYENYGTDVMAVLDNVEFSNEYGLSDLDDESFSNWKRP